MTNKQIDKLLKLAERFVKVQEAQQKATQQALKELKKSVESFVEKINGL